VRFLILITNLVARIWTIFRSLINTSLCGLHTEFAYSKWDLAKLLYYMIDYKVELTGIGNKSQINADDILVI